MQPLGEHPYTTWDPVELQLRADGRFENRYVDVEVTGRFEHESGETHEVPGFWDGGDVWKLRFSPPASGRWTVTVDASPADPGLAGEVSFDVADYEGPNPIKTHGFLEVGPNDRQLVHADGTPFFWLGDTAWPAAAKATPEEWRSYLTKRSDQGFNVVHMNTLPQWDASKPQNRLPFGQGWNLDDPDPEYFRALDDLVAMAHDRGMVPALVALWFNYVESSYGRTFPRTFSKEEAARLGRYLGARYGAYGPTWFVSGDAKITDDSAEMFDAVAAALRESVTHPLLTTHIMPRQTTPANVNDREWLDYYIYQSGHHAGDQKYNPFKYATESRELDPDRPVINSEPCYERHGYFEEPRIRVSRAAVRRAGWWSVLAGANAGLSYGAHGIWHWHRRGEYVPSAEDRAMPEPWEDAIEYPGADDYAYLKEFLGQFQTGELVPRQDALIDMEPTVRAATLPADDAVIVYTPDARSITLDPAVLDGEDSVLDWIDPTDGRRITATAEWEPESVVVNRQPWNRDGILFHQSA